MLFRSFGKFGDVLAKVKSQTEGVLTTLGQAETRSRAMGRALRQVEALPDARAQALMSLDRDRLDNDTTDDSKGDGPRTG